MEDLISVIVPVYKVEKYLEKCVRSIITQSYKKLEIILVDDGSPDKCGILCDKFSLEDNRIKVIHKENGGLSDARNVGIDLCTGKYIAFIDSDDYISEDYIEYLYNLIKENNCDISVCGVQTFYEGCEPKYSNEQEHIQIMNKEDTLKTMYYQKLFDHSAWAKLYDATLLKEIRYPKGKLYEDAFTTYKLINIANKVAVGLKKKYFYLIRKNSIMTSNFNSRKLDVIEAMNDVENFTREYYPNIVKAALSRKFSANVMIFLSIPEDENSYDKERREVWGNIKSMRGIVISDRNARLKNRIAAVVSYLGPRMLKKINKINR